MKQNDPEKIQIGYDSESSFVWCDITGLIPIFHSCFERINAADRKKKIDRLLSSFAWHEHYKNKTTGRRILSETSRIEYPHELITAKFLTQSNYDVIFAPRAMFKPLEKKFDVFLIRDTIILKADLKHTTSKNPDTIAKRIKYGSEQASRVVLHINSNINRKELINALRSGVERNSLIKEVLLFYRGKFYRLRKLQILSKAILKLI